MWTGGVKNLIVDVINGWPHTKKIIQGLSELLVYLETIQLMTVIYNIVFSNYNSD